MALADLFVQVLKLCQTAGLVKLGHVALDGTKIKANAGLNKAMSYGRMKRAEVELAAEVQDWLTRAAEAHQMEDHQFGGDRRGDEMPDWIADKQKRLANIRTAKAALEAEARAKAQAATPAHDPAAGGRPRPGRKPKPVCQQPDDKAQRNFTDPDSRVMPTRSGFIQGYNAQAAVDGERQIIVAHTLVNTSSDQGQLTPLLNAIKTNLRRNPAEASADAGYCSHANLRTLSRRRIAGYIATGRQRHGSKAATGRRTSRCSLVEKMRTKLKRAGYRSRYRLRKQIVEPGVRSDQAGQRVPPVPPPRSPQSAMRMGAHLHRS